MYLPDRGIWIVILALCVTVCAPAGAQNMLMEHDIGESDYIPPPRLISPSTDVVDLHGAECLEFRWSAHEGNQVKREYYDLRIYKGAQAFGQDRIFIARIPPRQWSACVSSDIFENGGIYTFTLRQAYRGVKSRRTFQTFRVIK